MTGSCEPSNIPYGSIKVCYLLNMYCPVRRYVVSRVFSHVHLSLQIYFNMKLTWLKDDDNNYVHYYACVPIPVAARSKA
jgi:hypothetical protein